MKITHQIDRGGRVGIIKGRFESVAMHGPSGPNGDGLALGFPPFIYNEDGLLKKADGSDYDLTVSVPGVNTSPPDITLTIIHGNKEVFVRTFSPVLLRPADTYLNLNEAFARGSDVAATVTQLVNLATGLAQQASDHAATTQSLADNAHLQDATSQLLDMTAAQYANLLALADLNQFYAGVAASAAQYQLLYGWSVQPIEQGAALQITSNNNTAALSIFVDDQGTITYTADPARLTLSTDADGQITVEAV